MAIPKACAGEDEIYLEAGIPSGWIVGDQLVIAGTSVNGGYVPSDANVLENARNISVVPWQGYEQEQSPKLVEPIDNFSLPVSGTPAVIDLSSLFVDPDGDPLEYNVLVDDPELLQASIQGSILRLNTTGEMTGEARIRIYARNLGGCPRIAPVARKAEN